MRILPASSVLCVTVLIAGCVLPDAKPPAETSASSPGEPASQPAADLATEYRERAASGGVVYAMDPAASRVLIFVFRGGLAAKAGHNHVISVPRFEGYVHLPADEPSKAQFDLHVPVQELVVDEPGLRAETGGSFSGERSSADIEGTKRNMLGPRGLDANAFPLVHFKSLSVAGDWPILVADVAVTLHGMTRQQPVLLRVQRDNAAIQVTGALSLRQSDFGITPFSLFGGVLSVQDAVVIEFQLTGQATSL